MNRNQHLKIIPSFIVITIAVILTISLIWLSKDLLEHTRRFEQKVMYSNALISNSAKGFLWEVDEDGLKETLEQLVESDPEILKIKISSPAIESGKIIIKSPQQNITNSKTYNLNINKKDIYLGSIDVTYSKKTLSYHLSRTTSLVVVIILSYLLLIILLRLYWRNEQRLWVMKESQYKSIYNKVKNPIFEFSISYKNAQELASKGNLEDAIQLHELRKIIRISQSNIAFKEFVSHELGCYDNILKYIPQDVIFKVANMAIIDGEIPPQSLKFNNIYGQKKHLSLQGTTYSNLDNSEYSILISSIDLTELHKAVDSEKRLIQQMHKMQRMQSIGTLVGGIAHDFNNLLLAISGYNEILSFKVSDKEQELITGINNAITSARTLTTQMMNYSYSKFQEDACINLNQTIENTQSIIKSGIPVRIDVSYNVCKEILYVVSIPAKILQIIINLTTNSHHSISQSSGGKITVSLNSQCITKEQALLYQASKGERYACITVADNGEGITQENIDKIFDPFFTTKDVDKGTGLGLYVVFGIVQNMQGFIQLESVVDEGTQFHVYLPLVKPEVTNDTSI
ncbi:MAG: ATP-binding protein [Pseudomonadota bacterium]